MMAIPILVNFKLNSDIGRKRFLSASNSQISESQPQKKLHLNGQEMITLSKI